MKKILLSVAFLGATFVGANAQQGVIWSDENFNETWSTIDADGDGQNWHFVNGGTDADPDIWLRSFSYINGQGPVTPDNYIISPVIDLTGQTENITLTWKVAGQDPAYSVEKYSVYVATESAVNTAQTAADVVNIFLNSSVSFSETVTDNGPGGITNFYQKKLDISSFLGENVYVAFRHHDSTDEFAILIDDVEVVLSTFSVEDHLASSFSIYPNPATDVINISNSLDTIENITITDLNGRVVKETTLGTEQVQINISDLAQGVYILNATSNGKAITEKIVKK